MVVATAITDEAGRYQVDNLQPGPYTLTASAYAPAATHVHVLGGPNPHTDIALGRPAPPGPHAPSGDALHSLAAGNGRPLPTGPR